MRMSMYGFDYRCASCGSDVQGVHSLTCAILKKRVPNTDPKMSARPCGCDPGANHVCEWHSEAPQRVVGSNPPCIREQELTRPTNPVQNPSYAPLPTDAKVRKTYPITSGALDYFPDAIAEVAHVSYIGNEQHNPGQPLHWDRAKSTDEADALVRHLLERGKLDKDGIRHTAKVAWRALALLQKEIEADRCSTTASPTGGSSSGLDSSGGSSSRDQR